MQIIKKSIAVVGIIFALRFGIYGLLYFQLISAVIDYNLDAYYGGRLINYSIGEQLMDILPTVSLALLAGLVTWQMNRLFAVNFAQHDLLRLIISGIVYYGIYLGVSTLAKLAPVMDFRELMLKNKN